MKKQKHPNKSKLLFTTVQKTNLYVFARSMARIAI